MPVAGWKRACRKLGWVESKRAAHGRGMEEEGWDEGGEMGWSRGVGWKNRVEEVWGEGWRGMKRGG